MSSYPPPQPGTQPPFDPASWRAQQRAWQSQQKFYRRQQKDYARAQRAQQKAQARALRGRSLVGPSLLVGLGILFLLTQTGALTWSGLLLWYAHWWPLVLLAAGVVLLVEWFVARQRLAAGGISASPTLGGGVIFLLILLASSGWSLRWADDGREWVDHFTGPAGWSRLVGDPHESDDSLTQSLPAGAPLQIVNPRGDVTVTGSSQDGQMHLTLHKKVYSWSSADAENKLTSFRPVISTRNGQTTVRMELPEGGTADLTVELPHETPTTISASRGDVSVSELRGPLTISADRGDIALSAITGAVTLHVNYDDASIAAHSITGQIDLRGRSGDINLSDINGGTVLQGDFFGSTHIEHVNGIVRFETSRTQFQAARLDGSLELDGGSDLSANNILGPVLLNTRNRNITLDRVEGHVDIRNRNGSVNVTAAMPLNGILINNERGSVDVGLPAKSSVNLNAQTSHGDIENDFGLHAISSDDSNKQTKLVGTIAGGANTVSIRTTEGDITIRQSTVNALPLPPPPPPPLTMNPPQPLHLHPGKKVASPAPPAPPSAP